MGVQVQKVNSRPLLIFAVIAAIAMSVLLAEDALLCFRVRNMPIVTGRVVDRNKSNHHFFVPATDFTIHIDQLNVEVHALTQQYLHDKVEDDVRFHYSGDPTREVFLFEYEENPYWILLTCWGVAIICIIRLIAARKNATIRHLITTGRNEKIVRELPKVKDTTGF